MAVLVALIIDSDSRQFSAKWYAKTERFEGPVMAKFGNGYGSECHMLRYLGRHRSVLDDRVRGVVGCDELRWLDFPFDKLKAKWPDAEWKGIDFIPDNSALKAKWRKFWPQTGNVQNWDAVAEIKFGKKREWLLIEAKAHLGEIRSSCGAKEHGGLPLIRRALSRTKADLGVDEKCNWLRPYYQCCNRVAVLNFLLKNNVPSRSLFIYFIGDHGSSRRICPKKKSEWTTELKVMEAHIGIPKDHAITTRIHKLFLNVKGD